MLSVVMLLILLREDNLEKIKLRSHIENCKRKIERSLGSMFGSVDSMDMYIEPGTGKVRYTFRCPIEVCVCLCLCCWLFFFKFFHLVYGGCLHRLDLWSTKVVSISRIYFSVFIGSH